MSVVTVLDYRDFLSSNDNSGLGNLDVLIDDCLQNILVYLTGTATGFLLHRVCKKFCMISGVPKLDYLNFLKMCAEEGSKNLLKRYTLTCDRSCLIESAVKGGSLETVKYLCKYNSLIEKAFTYSLRFNKQNIFSWAIRKNLDEIEDMHLQQAAFGGIDVEWFDTLMERVDENTIDINILITNTLYDDRVELFSYLINKFSIDVANYKNQIIIGSAMKCFRMFREQLNLEERDYVSIISFSTKDFIDEIIDSVSITTIKQHILSNHNVDHYEYYSLFTNDELLSQKSFIINNCSISFVQKFFEDNEMTKYDANVICTRGREFCEFVLLKYQGTLEPLHNCTKVIDLTFDRLENKNGYINEILGSGNADLLDRYMKLNIFDVTKNTIINHSINFSEEMFLVLLDYIKIDPKIQEYLIKNGRDDLWKLAIEKGNSPSVQSLNAAVKDKNKKFVRYYLSKNYKLTKAATDNLRGRLPRIAQEFNL